MKSLHKKKFDLKNLSRWDVKNVSQWIVSIGFDDCKQYFMQHKINGLALLMLNEEDVKEIISHNVGQRKNLYHFIQDLQIKYNHYMNKVHSDSFFAINSEDSDSSSNDEHTESTKTINYQKPKIKTSKLKK